MGLASCFAKWRVDLLVHHRGAHLVAERSDAFQLHRAAVLHIQNHNLGQRRQHRLDVGVARCAPFFDVLGLSLAIVLADTHRPDRPFACLLRKYLSGESLNN